MKRAALIFLGLLLSLLIVVVVQIYFIQPYHDGRCGDQKTEGLIFWSALDQIDYDEFGIIESWTNAHPHQACKRVWVKGPLKANASEYWPRLHFRIAAGVRVDEIRREISAATKQELFQVDPLGRTILHWLVIHPNEKDSRPLVDELVRKGLSLDARDEDGLSPRDWAGNIGRSY